MKLTTADGRQLTYRKLGHGPALVCHPGGPGCSSSFLGDLAGMWEDYTLILLNPRGTGGSDRPADRRGYAIDDYVADLEDVRRHLGLERMFLLGHSHGGVVVQTYAARHPDRVDKLVLASTLARFGPEQEAAMRAGMEKRSTQPWYADAAAALEDEQVGGFESDEKTSELVFREMPLYFARFGPSESGYLETLRTEPFNADALRLWNEEIFETFDLRPLNRDITAPTLVITGSEDFICGPVCADEISAGIAGSRQVTIGDAGHVIFVEQPEQFRSAVGDFLSS
ncbi:MAG TPA: alpha/beta hydrolase [Patescibacteria group bacterium]|nr:alpha/beta hydrolase [Patescibacteria group bacterium]